VAAKPRATNSSSAASRMAWRRTAARAARLEGGSDGAFGTAGFDALSEAALSPRRRMAGFAAADCGGRVRELDMGKL